MAMDPSAGFFPIASKTALVPAAAPALKPANEKLFPADVCTQRTSGVSRSAREGRDACLAGPLLRICQCAYEQRLT